MQSLKTLAEWANELADGNTEFKVPSGPNDETGKIAAALERIREYLAMQSENVRMIADGNLSNEIKIASDKDVLSNAVNLLKNNIWKLDSETKLLYEAALEGTLSEMAGQAQMLKGMIHEFKLINYDNRLSGRKMETKALYKIKL